MIGFININKPSGITSNAVVSKIKKILNVKKVGHMGTLDPLACGVLPVAVGKAARMFEHFLDKEKKYLAIFEFGYETDTLDSEGKILHSSGKIPSLKEITKILPDFVGGIDQIPPQYSAKSVGGVRAYKLARQGKLVDLKPKRVTVYKIEVFDNDKKSYRFEISCSSGTYIRSLCRDVAYKLGAFATMTYLQRTESGSFKIADATSLDSIDITKLDKMLTPIEEVFNKIPILEVDSDKFNKLLNGQTVSLEHPIEGKVFVKNNGRLLGVGNIENGGVKIETNLFDEDIMQR